jgi:TetR/AcrR family transcriptional regulator, cholesterol catabolism regulator
MEDKRTEIIVGAYEIFKTYGIRSISMDDIAAKLRVSKKTLYQFYKNKGDLISEIIDYSIEAEIELFGKIPGGNAIETFMQMTDICTGIYRDINPLILFDMQKYHTELADKFFEKRTALIFETICGNLRQGISEGLYRSDINPELIASLYTDRVKDIRKLEESDILKNFSFADIIGQLAEGHIRGAGTDSGIEYFEKYKENQTPIGDEDNKN